MKMPIVVIAVMLFAVAGFSASLAPETAHAQGAKSKTTTNVLTIPTAGNLTLSVSRADNLCVVIVNGAVAYTRGTDGDPLIPDNNIDLSAHLHKGKNYVTVIGVNWGGPSHFVGTLTSGGRAVGQWDFTQGGDTKGLTYQSSYELEQN